MDGFSDAFAALVNVEKGFTDNPMDSGNWTSGRVGVGACRGTKYGISAAQYPDLDIVNLTLDQAKAIAKQKYWDRFHCDEMDPRIGFQVFDAAYNGGPAARWLQQAAGVPADGDIGPQTVAAVKAADPLKIIMRIDAYRLQYLAGLREAEFADGWMNRIAGNLIKGAAA
jgi:lysozyme family protein